MYRTLVIFNYSHWNFLQWNFITSCTINMSSVQSIRFSHGKFANYMFGYPILHFFTVQSDSHIWNYFLLFVLVGLFFLQRNIRTAQHSYVELLGVNLSFQKNSLYRRAFFLPSDIELGIQRRSTRRSTEFWQLFIFYNFLSWGTESELILLIAERS